MNSVLLLLTLRRLLKFLHTLGAAGFMGGLAALVIVIVLPSAPSGGAEGFGAVQAMARIGAWIVGPSMIVTVISGLLAMLANPAFYDIGWVWAKAATGILILEGGLHVLGPVQEAAKRGAHPVGHDMASAASLLAAEANTMWVLLAVSAANVALAIWRPRLLPP